jgi:hypothetical protein
VVGKTPLDVLRAPVAVSGGSSAVQDCSPAAWEGGGSEGLFCGGLTGRFVYITILSIYTYFV